MRLAMADMTGYMADVIGCVLWGCMIGYMARRYTAGYMALWTGSQLLFPLFLLFLSLTRDYGPVNWPRGLPFSALICGGVCCQYHDMSLVSRKQQTKQMPSDGTDEDRRRITEDSVLMVKLRHGIASPGPSFCGIGRRGSVLYGIIHVVIIIIHLHGPSDNW